MYKTKICIKCNKGFQPTSGNQKYCGNEELKKGCSWLIQQERKKKELKRYREKYPEKIKKHRKKNKEKERLRQQRRRLKLRFQILQRDNFTCQYCGRKAPNVVLQIDHKYPKSKGGLNKMENYITSCQECNLGKGDIILKEFLARGL